MPGGYCFPEFQTAGLWMRNASQGMAGGRSQEIILISRKRIKKAPGSIW